MAKKFTSNEVANICNKLPGLLHKHAGNGTKAAADLGLESFNVLRGLMSNYPSIQDAYNRGFDLITQEVLEAHLGAAMDRRRGMNTQASGRYLQAAMPDRFNPAQRVEDVTGYAKPAASDEAARRGINEWKRERLIQAGADVIIPDFREQNALLAYLLD